MRWKIWDRCRGFPWPIIFGLTLAIGLCALGPSIYMFWQHHHLVHTTCQSVGHNAVEHECVTNGKKYKWTVYTLFNYSINGSTLQGLIHGICSNVNITTFQNDMWDCWYWDTQPTDVWLHNLHESVPLLIVSILLVIIGFGWVALMGVLLLSLWCCGDPHRTVYYPK